jgi:hypothetical protein
MLIYQLNKTIILLSQIEYKDDTFFSISQQIKEIIL